MSVISFLIDFVLHIDRYIGSIAQDYGAFTYVVLFFIIFLETGLVITPFLPGDSLLFVLGAFSAQGTFNLILLFFLLTIAAILGDSVNYWIGSYFGEKVFAKSRFFKKEHLERTQEFYKKHGGKTIILARFVPIIRTFAPFVAGIGKMNYPRFLTYNIIGGVSWIALFLLAGYFFGNIKLVAENLTMAIYLIVILSFIPIIWEYIRHKRKGKK
ncbi:MAG: DedA family protein [Nanoarchaeota archaeon]|nr:DedA family protein [Nanoarchaeota archaeon]